MKTNNQTNANTNFSLKKKNATLIFTLVALHIEGHNKIYSYISEDIKRDTIHKWTMSLQNSLHKWSTKFENQY